MLDRRYAAILTRAGEMLESDDDTVITWNATHNCWHGIVHGTEVYVPDAAVDVFYTDLPS